jgi:hypothetical protein
MSIGLSDNQACDAKLQLVEPPLMDILPDSDNFQQAQGLKYLDINPSQVKLKPPL